MGHKFLCWADPWQRAHSGQRVYLTSSFLSKSLTQTNNLVGQAFIVWLIQVYAQETSFPYFPGNFYYVVRENSYTSESEPE